MKPDWMQSLLRISKRPNSIKEVYQIMLLVDNLMDDF